ncbi:hypothetical protein JOQ06_022682 [Pogonophryne albipinna]|uniref:G-patch domain and KOW motifs-containing protein n=1 Tax=Pogonophryne albipinna TaxID=1090488 RepID=A0AAD6AAA5_9TELE|nr:hypothetical protein JOQ06_022682 [Pogonophryne albipinna]
MASHGEDVPEDQTEKKPAPLSFGFTKTVSKFKPSSVEGVTEREEKDFLTGIDGKELQSTKPSEKPKELIIPLIQKNPKTQEAKTQEAAPENDSVESQAVKELIEDSRRQLEEWQNGPQAENLNLYIPLLMQNQVPEGFEDGDHVKVDLRPESSTEADYACVPVEAYGIAMLKGMGWNKEEGIGRTFKQHVMPIESQLRPKGLGLGADRAAIKDLEPTKHKRPPKPGAHKELYGKIEGLDPDNARVVVKLAIGGRSATISQHAVKLVGRTEYEKNCKDLTRLKSSQDRDKPPVKEARRPPPPPSWLQRDLKVRFIDKSFKGGKYYNSKMCVEDVLSPSTCICRTDEGRLIDDVKQGMLETIIPKLESESIMVVLGEHRGQVGRILQRDKNKCRAMVQLDRHEEKVFMLDYDIICQYVGETDH